MQIKILPLLALCVAANFFSGPARAATIQGDIDFSGVITFDTMSLDTVTRVNLWNVSFVSQRSGDFASYTNFGDNSTMAAPWIFNNGTPAYRSRGTRWQLSGKSVDSPSICPSQAWSCKVRPSSM